MRASDGTDAGSGQSSPAGPASPATSSGSGGVRPAGRSRPRWTGVLLLLAVLVPYGLAVTQLGQRTGDDLAFARGEQDGLVLAAPIVRLIAQTTNQASAAATGTGEADARTALRTAMAEVDAAERGAGRTLGSTQRWSDVRGQLTSLLGAAPAGAVAYARYAAVTDLELTMLQAVADSSNLILDPQLDSYYLMDATLLRLPHLLVDAGRYADLSGAAFVTVAERAPALAVLADRMQGELSAVDEGLRKAFDATASQTVGPAVLGPLDRLRGAASELVPPGILAGAGPGAGASSDARPVAAVQAARSALRDAALAFEEPAMLQLKLLVVARAQGLELTRRWAAGAGGAGLLVMVGIAWLRAPRRPRPGSEAVPEPASGPGKPGRKDHLDGARSPDDEALAEVQALLNSGRLVRVGRALAATRDDR